MSVFGNHRILSAVCFACVSSLASAAEVKPLESYRETERLWMGMEEGVVRPAAYEQVRADAEGFVALHAEDGQFLEKGAHWATLDPEQLELERRAFDVDKAKQLQLLEKGREDAGDARIRMGLDLHDAEGKRDDLAEVSQDTGIPEALRRRAGEAVAKLDERIAALHGKLDPANLERELLLLDEDCALQIARKEKQLLALEKRSLLVAAFPGQLRLGKSVKEKLAAAETGQALWMKSGDLIGTIVDDRHYEISISAAGPLLSEIPQDQLLVFLQDSQTGRLIAGEFSRMDETDSGREITRSFVFTIRDDGAESARQAMGTRNLVHVYRKFPRPYKLVYKKDIAFAAPEVLESAGWSGLVRHLWPGSKVIQVGPQTIAVEIKDAN